MKKFISITALLLAGTFGHAADIKGLTAKNVKEGSILIRYSIQDGDSQAFIDVYNEHAAKGNEVTAVLIDSMGGNEIESAKIAKFIMEKKLPTLTKHNGVCYDDCFLIAAAGVNLRYIKDSTIVRMTKMPLVEAQYPTLYKELHLPKAFTKLLYELKPNQHTYLLPDEKHKLYTQKQVKEHFVRYSTHSTDPNPGPVSTENTF